MSGNQQHQRGATVDAAEHQSGEDREHDAGRDVDEPVDEHRHVFDVVAEMSDRLACRADRLAGLWAAAGNLSGEQVGAQQRLHVHPRPCPGQRAEVDRAHPGELAQRQRAADPIHPRVVAGRERVEAATEQPSAQHRKGEEHHEQQISRPEAARFVLRDAPTEAPDAHRAITLSGASSSWARSRRWR